MASTTLVKARGEHWVCSVLAGLGWSVALTRDGMERTDILASHMSGQRMIEVQVKAATFRTNPNWPLGLKAQQVARSDREWFVLVVLGEQPWETNRGFVVPRDHVAAATWISHMNWRTDPNVAPGKRNATLDQARVSVSAFEGYEGRWDLLTEPATKAPVLLPAQYRDLVLETRIGLPEAHPWNDSLPVW